MLQIAKQNCFRGRNAEPKQETFCNEELCRYTEGVYEKAFNVGSLGAMRCVGVGAVGVWEEDFFNRLMDV